MAKLKARGNVAKSYSSPDCRKILTVLCFVAAFNNSDGVIDRCSPPCLRANKCYPGLGCFNILAPFPNVPPQDQIDTRFLLFNRPNTGTSFPLEANVNSLRSSTFDASLKTKVIVHGYSVKIPDIDFIFELKDKLLSHRSYNVILVDWTRSNGENILTYLQAIANARVVAAQLARLLTFLIENAPISPESIHIIGHSLGAHLSGWTGERLADSRKPVARISALDAAAPYFELQGASVRIDPTDAIFVDGIHTNIGNRTDITGNGIRFPVGHVDFYPNGGGPLQPGCPPEPTVAEEILPLNSCSHRRVVYLYTESVNNQSCSFQGVECGSWSQYRDGQCDNNRRAVMGFHATRPAGTSPGVRFYLRTAAQSPFCIPN